MAHRLCSGTPTTSSPPRWVPPRWEPGWTGRIPALKADRQLTPASLLTFTPLSYSWLRLQVSLRDDAGVPNGRRPPGTPPPVRGLCGDGVVWKCHVALGSSPLPTGQRARARAQHGRLFPSPPKSSQTPSQTGAPWLPCEGSPVSPACGDRPGSLKSTRSFLGAGSVPVPVTETQAMMGRSPQGPGGKGVYIVCHLWPEGARGWGTEMDSSDPPEPAHLGWREVLLAVLDGGLSCPHAWPAQDSGLQRQPCVSDWSEHHRGGLEACP